MDNNLKQEALIEALEFYIHNLKEIDANQAAIDLFNQVLSEVENETVPPIEPAQDPLWFP